MRNDGFINSLELRKQLQVLFVGVTIMPDERVAIFIDGSNFYHCVKDEFGKTSLDFGKLIDALCSDRELVRAYYYNAPVDQTSAPDMYRGQQRFFDALRQVPYFEIRLGRLEQRGREWVEKGVDVALAVNMLELAYRNVYDTAILVSGDADFSNAVEAVKALGKHVELAFVRYGCAQQLRQVCDRYVEMDSAFLKPIFR